MTTLFATNRFGIGGVQLDLSGPDPAQLERVARLWSRLFVLEPGPGTPGGVRLELVASALPERAGERVYTARALTVTRCGSSFDLTCGASQLRVQPRTGTAHCYMAADFFNHSLYETREFFLLGLLMLLRPHGLYGLHACGLESANRGLLIVGQSGAGKTTTSLTLIRQGWRYLSDDAVLLRQNAHGLEALAFRRGFSCTPNTLARFPELSTTVAFGDPEGKHVVDLGDSYGGGFTPSCTPRQLVFPTISDTATTTLHPLTALGSLVRLSQQSAGIMTDKDVSKRHLELLSTLAARARCFELRLGRDALEDPARVDTLLKGLD